MKQRMTPLAPTMFAAFLALALAADATASATTQQAQRRNWTINAAEVYTASGEALTRGVLVIEDGKIASLAADDPDDSGDSSDSSSAQGEQDDEGTLRVAAITPGMIDLSLRINGGLSSVEQTQEVTPGILVDGALDLFDEAWLRQARSGVTAGFVGPLDRNVVGGLGSVLKTAGSPSLVARVVASGAALRGSMGNEPSRGNRSWGTPHFNFYQRRPTTRMGVEWAWRKACYDAAYSRDDEEYAYPGSDVMLRALDGELPLFIQAWTTQDIRTAVFLKEEIEAEGLGQPRMVLDAAAEAWREPQLLVRSGVSIVIPPVPADGRTGDGALRTVGMAKELTDLGVTVALSAHGNTDSGVSLARQAGWAMRGGMSRAEALAAVTINPARMIGVDDRLGSLEVGKDADLVLWNGPPFELTSRVVGVLIDGKLIVDPRTSEAAQ